MRRQLSEWLWLNALGMLCGYGERPGRAIGWIIVTFIGLTLVYFLGSGLSDDRFPQCLYFSAASMTALGYGKWVPGADGWVRALGALESFLGIFLMALFVGALTRKMTR